MRSGHRSVNTPDFCRGGNLGDILYLCVQACIAVLWAHASHSHTHTHQAACLYVQISLPESATQPERSKGLFLRPLWPVNHCSHRMVQEFVKLFSYQCKLGFFFCFFLTFDHYIQGVQSRVCLMIVHRRCLGIRPWCYCFCTVIRTDIQ